MRVSRRHGRLRLRLDPAEVAVLLMLFDELAAVLDSDADGDRDVVSRLNPSAYPDDAHAEDEYREITAPALRTLRTERIDACRADLVGLVGPHEPVRGGLDLTDADVAQRWIQTLNDVRLALGTRLGVTEDEDPVIDPDDPNAQRREVYYWLTAVQDVVVRELMG